MDSSVLFVSPHVKDAQSLAKMLDQASFHVVHVVTLEEAARELGSHRISVVLTEARLEDGTWIDLLQLTRQAGAELVVTDAWADARFWAEAINLGAYDLLAQPFHRTEVQRVLSSASVRQLGAKAEAAGR